MQMRSQDPMASLNERAKVDYIISEGLYNYHLFDSEADRMHKVEEDNAGSWPSKGVFIALST